MNIPAFLVYCAIIAVTPGPNTLMSLYLGASGGSRFWRFFAGSMAGLLVKCALCGLLNVLLSEKIPALVPYLKWLGALYMLYLAFGMVRSGLKPAGDDQRSGEGSFQSGILLQVLNVKSWVAALSIIICMTCMFMFVRSKYGRSIRAIRDNEIAASASGINVNYYKVLTFTISAFFAGITGALYACCNAALATTSFAFTNGSILNSVFIVVMVVVGGMGSLTGSVIAAVVLFLLNYTIKNGAWVHALPAFLQNVFTYPMLVYSIALIVVIMFRPRGIMGSREFALCDVPQWPAKLRAGRMARKSLRKEAGHHV